MDSFGAFKEKSRSGRSSGSGFSSGSGGGSSGSTSISSSFEFYPSIPGVGVFHTCNVFHRFSMGPSHFQPRGYLLSFSFTI